MYFCFQKSPKYYDTKTPIQPWIGRSQKCFKNRSARVFLSKISSQQISVRRKSEKRSNLNYIRPFYWVSWSIILYSPSKCSSLNFFRRLSAPFRENSGKFLILTSFVNRLLGGSKYLFAFCSWSHSVNKNKQLMQIAKKNYNSSSDICVDQ